MEFHEKLRSTRKERGMSQEDLADQLGVSRQAVSKWEGGQGFPETEKLLQISTLFSVSLDYLLKGEHGEASENEEPGYYASREMVEGFLLCKRQGALRIGIGVAVIILSLAFNFALGDNHGDVLFLLGVAVGVCILVAQLFRQKRYPELENQPLLFDSAYIKEFRNMHMVRRKRYGMMIIIGIALILISFAANVLIDMLPKSSQDHASTILPLFWALAVFLFINSGSALNAEGVIANNAEHMKELESEKRNGWVWGSIMPFAAMCFLAIGFVWNAWHPGWLVFPVAAMICTAISGWRNSR